MCFAHVLLNTLDMKKRGYNVKLVIEGTATRSILELSDSGKPFAGLYASVRESGLIDCVCRACSAKTGTLESAEEQKLPLCDELDGHPSIARYIEEGYEILIF
jgi:hypothetical protein